MSLSETPVSIRRHLDDIDHFICCEWEDHPHISADAVPSLCGTSLEADDGELVNEVACVVCMDLDAVDYCNVRADRRCPLG